MKNLVAVVDCNNFYASCERVFNPKIEKRPVVILSNNDGCVIARSNEAKELGIKMGEPAFMFKTIFSSYNVAVYSANFPLYADMSNRVMSVLSRFSPRIEIYSIDEAFLSFNEYTYRDLIQYGKEIRQTIKKWTGIPVSIGIAYTKTLSKIANDIAKRNPEYEGVVGLMEGVETDKLLHKVDVSDVWGVGRAFSKMLYNNNIYTALQLKNMPDTWVRTNMHITGLRMVHELRGIQCIELEHITPSKKSIISSKSFGKYVETIEDLQEAVATFATRAAEKLRQEKLLASTIHISITTNWHNPAQKQYANSFGWHLSEASSYTPDLIHGGFEALKRIYKPGYRYKKATVTLTGLIPESETQIGLFNPVEKVDKNKKVAHAVDNINRYWGRETLRFAAEGVEDKPWRQHPNFISSRYTTRWDELLKVSI